MKLIETHAHIYLKEFKDDLPEVIDRAKEAGVEAIYMPNVDHTTIDDMLKVADDYPGYCIPMMGLHPCSVTKDFEKDLYEVEEWLNKGGFAAVGEMGTDLYWDKTYWAEQQEAFKVQANLAEKHNLPLVIHCRETIDETIQLVEETGYGKGVFHCFTGSVEQAKQIITLGYKLGMGGVTTFKNGGMEPVLKEISEEYFVLETDSPYLTPAPYRGKRNEPFYLEYVRKKIAEEKGVSEEHISITTTENALKLFSNAG